MKKEKAIILVAILFCAIAVGVLISHHYAVQAQQQQNLNNLFSSHKYEDEAQKIKAKADAERKAAIEQADYEAWLKSVNESEYSNYMKEHYPQHTNQP
jgi:hypothetical protein